MMRDLFVSKHAPFCLCVFVAGDHTYYKKNSKNLINQGVIFKTFFDIWMKINNGKALHEQIFPIRYILITSWTVFLSTAVNDTTLCFGPDTIKIT